MGGLDRKVAILDLAAGTGLLGAEITSHGYENVDGLDSSLGMLGQARKQCIYQDYIVSMVDGLGSIPINDETYDVVMSSNGFAPGQIYPKAIPDIEDSSPWRLPYLDHERGFPTLQRKVCLPGCPNQGSCSSGRSRIGHWTCCL